MTQTKTPVRVDQLPRDAGSSRRNVGAGLAALVGSLVLLVGVPVLLVKAVGNPLPGGPPSQDWLTAQVTPTLVLDVLAVLVWIVWAHFVACFLSEWRALRRGRMPGNVLLGGGSQLLARRLVAGLLMLTGGLSMAQGLAQAAVPAPSATTSAAQTAAAAVAADGRVQAAEAAAVAAAQDVPTPAVGAVGAKHYEVVPPQGRHHDTLWDISERLLGDPMRYREIYELNQHRLQPDGRRLTDADLIRPGWELLLPADAKGPGVRVAPTPVTHPAPAVSTAGLSGSVAEGAAPVADRAPATEVTPTAAPAGVARSASDQAEWLLLGGGLILAGALRAITAQRGPFGEPDEAAVELAAAAGVRRAELLDDALRSLAEARFAQAQPMPDLRFVYVNDDQVVLHLLGDRGQEVAPEAPWTVAEDGRSWSLRAEHLVRPAVGTAAPYPSLVDVATTHGFDILVDLELAPGLVAVAGDVGVARDVVTAMALDLTTHAWSDALDVVMVGFGDHLVDLDTGRARQVADLDALLDQIGSTQHQQASVLAELGVQGVLQGRQSGQADDCTPTVVFLSGSPTADQARRLAELTSGGRTSFAVVCVGDSPSARWRFVVDASGRLESTAIGVSGDARRLDREAQRRLQALLADARSSRTAGADVFDNGSPAALAEQAAPAASTDPAVADVTSAPVAVRLLGEVRVEAPGDLDEARRGLLTELVVMTALHPDGLHPAVLRSSLWPRGVEEDVVEARIEDARRWLGHDDEGRPRIGTDAGGRVWLSDEVGNDYAALVAAAQSTEPGELERLVGALELGTGEAFSGAGRTYGWLAFAREARTARLLAASVARRAADLAAAAGRYADAEHALRLGLRLVPTAEALWRTLLRLQAQHDPGAVADTVDEMYLTLQGHGASHEPETEALVVELVPERARVRGA